MSEIATVSPFEALGTNLRFGSTEDGTPFVVAADFARSLDYRDAERALRLLDEDERGTRLVGTPNGRTIEMGVIYEDGIWELIFRSTKPEAKALKKRVKEILAEIRRTGSYSATPDVPALPQTYAEALRELAASVEEREVLAGKVAELEPAARSWHVLAQTDGDYLVGDAAKILQNDYDVDTGPNRLFGQMQTLGWVYRGGDRAWRAKQTQITTGRLRERLTTRPDHDTGERVAAPPQVRVTVKGIGALYELLPRQRRGGQLRLVDGEAS